MKAETICIPGNLGMVAMPRIETKNKNKKQQPTSWLAASTWKKQNKQQNDCLSRFSSSHALSDFFHCIYHTSPTRYNRAYNSPTVGPTIKAVIFWVSFVGPTSVLRLKNSLRHWAYCRPRSYLVPGTSVKAHHGFIFIYML